VGVPVPYSVTIPYAGTVTWALALLAATEDGCHSEPLDEVNAVKLVSPAGMCATERGAVTALTDALTRTTVSADAVVSRYVELRARGLERRDVLGGEGIGRAAVALLEVELVLQADRVEGGMVRILESAQERREPARELGERARGARAVVELGERRVRDVEAAAGEVPAPDEWPRDGGGRGEAPPEWVLPEETFTHGAGENIEP
jgi:hypothetical protein